LIFHGNSRQGPRLVAVELKNDSSISHLYRTASSAFCQTGTGVNIPQQNERIALKDVNIVWRQVMAIDSLDEVDLLRFGQPRAI
jgi:hypothetical protein